MHELPPEIKILSALLFVIVVVATPIRNWLAHIVFFLMLLLLIRLAKLPYRTVFLRSLVEIPFVLFAFLMPFFGTGSKLKVLGIELYESGLWAGAGIIAKGTIGVVTAIILSGSTTAREILGGLEKLRVPAPLVSIATFMLRYLNVINDELGRMKIARESRGFEERGLKSWRILAQTVGALFIRSYERGERVYLAMLSRGFAGAMPRLAEDKKTNWLVALILPGVAVTLSFISGAL
ncbi:MAG: cobalt ECF transporter T component CbiQ [Candidatus Nanopelagicaceae bacterium]|nr:cobalt ECF transporter T component CbiQ [Candidatus Nanopelagicaceae bacterium]